MEFGNNLRKIRKSKRLSQEDIADALGISRQAVAKWENGSAYPDIDNLILLTLLLLYRSGYIVGKYISIEKMVELSKETYYEALQASSIGWHENESDYAPFVRYTLGTIVNAYREFSSRVKLLTTSGIAKADRVREMIKETIGKITKPYKNRTIKY